MLYIYTYIYYIYSIYTYIYIYYIHIYIYIYISEFHANYFTIFSLITTLSTDVTKVVTI